MERALALWPAAEAKAKLKEESNAFCITEEAIDAWVINSSPSLLAGGH